MIVHLNDKPVQVPEGTNASELLKRLTLPARPELWLIDRWGIPSRIDTARRVTRLLPGDRLYLRKTASNRKGHEK